MGEGPVLADSTIATAILNVLNEQDGVSIHPKDIDIIDILSPVNNGDGSEEGTNVIYGPFP